MLWPPLTIGLLVGILVFFFLGSDELYSLPEYVVGTRAQHVLLQEAYAQKEYTYTDLIGKYSSWQALFDLGANGGVYDPRSHPCGQVQNEIVLWNRASPARPCFPTKEMLVKNYSPYVQKAMNTYLLRHYLGEALQDNYRISLIEKENNTHIIGIALKPMYYTFPPPSASKADLGKGSFSFSPPTVTSHPNIPDGKIITALYALKLDFHTQLPYSFDQFVVVGQKANETLQTCALEEVRSCVERKKTEFTTPDQTWEVQIFANDIYTFKVTDHLSNPYFEKEPVYAFALHIPPSQPTP
ncbi:hypothetical protein J4410_02050 [Candidatus Woesearchaeota archaeon]|nr:hypothetical protein [Candidatus Woesearchaeota archaeon]